MSTRLTADPAKQAAAFFALRTVEDLASLLDVKPSQLGYYAYRSVRYKSFEIAKRSGGKRSIHAPDSALKLIQKKLSQVLLAVYKGRGPVHGFAKGRSILSNARRHHGCSIVLNFDLMDYFPSIHFGRVLGLFSGKPYLLPRGIAVTLARICCYQKMLPAGAPTSPIVSNMICAKMDSQLKGLANRLGCVYTRYADDITFSSRAGRFPPGIVYRDKTSRMWVVGNVLNDIISRNGFRINVSKTRVGTKHSRREITGIVLSERLNVNRKLLRQVRAMLHACERHGNEAADREFKAKYDRKHRAGSAPPLNLVLLGKLDFVGFVRGKDDPLFLKLRARYLALNPTATLKPVTLGRSAIDEALTQAVWLLEGAESDMDAPQATAFAVEGYGLLTANHAVMREPMFASRPKISPKKYPVTVLRRAAHQDIAQVQIDYQVPVQLQMGPVDGLKPGTAISLLGFPRYNLGDGVQIAKGDITQERVYSGVRHFVIGPTIVKGNSGGPILDGLNRVVGIAVKGVDTPGRFTDRDELSSFVPVSELVHLK